MSYQYERLDKNRHDRTRFDCGNEPLNRYLRETARQSQEKGAAVCFVLVDDETGYIAGYYTLTQHAIDAGDVNPELFGGHRKLPRSKMLPATLLGRLAIDQHYQGQGLGAALLARALETALAAAEKVAAVAVVVDPDGETAARFYEHHGFRVLNEESGRMFITMGEIAETLAAEE